MTHICIAIGHLNCGGAEKIASSLANHFALNGCTVSMVTLTRSPPFYGLAPSVRLIQIDGDSQRKPKIIRWLARFFGIRGVIREIRPSVILSFMFPAFLLFATNGLNVPTVITIRNDPKRLMFPETVFIRKFLYKKALAVIAQTEYAAGELMRQTGHENIQVIPNFVESIEFERATQPEHSKEKGEVISVGRLIPSKGFDDLLRIFAGVRKEGWRLRIVGDGPEKKALEALAGELELDDAVLFHGFETDVFALLANAAIFAFCSKSEGFPNALLEAMATPLCCISYDCVAGPSDLIESGKNGVLVPLNDEVKFAESLRMLMGNVEERERMARSAGEIAREYSVDAIGKKYLDTLLGCGERNG